MINRHLSRIIIISVLLLECVVISGCSGNRKEIQKLSMVVAVGIDLTEDKKFEVTMQILNPSASSTQTDGGQGTGGGDETLVYSGIGDTFHEAVNQVSVSMGRVPHFGHTKYIVLGETLTQTNVIPIIDTLLRTEEVRLNVPVLVTRGNASAIIKAKTKENPIPAIVVENIFFRQELVGYRPLTYLLDLANELTEKGTSPTIGVLELVKPTEKKGDETFKLAGTAVFEKGKLIGYLNAKETRGLRFIRGKIEVGSITFITSKHGMATSEIIKSSSKIKPVLKGDSITVNIDIKIISTLRRVGGKIDAVKNPKTLDELSKNQNRAVKEEIKLALAAGKEKLGADIFGIGTAIHKSYPKEWKKLEENWSETFRNINIEINVDSKIKSIGLTSKYIED